MVSMEAKIAITLWQASLDVVGWLALELGELSFVSKCKINPDADGLGASSHLDGSDYGMNDEDGQVIEACVSQFGLSCVLFSLSSTHPFD